MRKRPPTFSKSPAHAHAVAQACRAHQSVKPQEVCTGRSPGTCALAEATSTIYKTSTFFILHCKQRLCPFFKLQAGALSLVYFQAGPLSLDNFQAENLSRTYFQARTLSLVSCQAGTVLSFSCKQGLFLFFTCKQGRGVRREGGGGGVQAYQQPPPLRNIRPFLRQTSW